MILKKPPQIFYTGDVLTDYIGDPQTYEKNKESGNFPDDVNLVIAGIKEKPIPQKNVELEMEDASKEVEKPQKVQESVPMLKKENVESKENIKPGKF